MRYDLILKNGIIVSPTESVQGDVAISNGKIAKTGNLEPSDTANEIYDAQGKHILPGIIDAHVHFRDPGLTEKEDFETGSMAAAMGGITTAADMPNVIPVTSTAERFNEKIKIAKEKSYIDFALFALLTNENMDEIRAFRDAGALGFKVFLGTSTGDIASPSPAVLMQEMREIATFGMRTGFHAETSEINSYFTELAKKETEKMPHNGFSFSQSSYGFYLEYARPVFSEVLAIQTAICYAQYTKAKIHIHHVTSSEGALLVSEAKQKGINLTAEVCPHHLLIDNNKEAHKVYPPIRDVCHRQRLWEAIGNGTIDMIASDHAPHTVAEKALPIWESPAGLCGVETSVPLMLNKVNEGSFSINDYVRLASEAPAKIWGIYPQKGNLLPGADADITVVDMKMKKKISACDLHSKSKTSPYDGMKVQGAPVATIVRGTFVMREGKLTGQKGFANLVSPAL
ncbi:MAG: dihydroorotase family protein [Treponema sp.]|jgi:dihydroorotase|nr:dihydroorotase family protein [Treponema sp.]